MKIKDLIEELQGLDQEADAEPWIKAKATNSAAVLSFDDGGRAIRCLLKVLGKPYLNYNHDMSGRRMHCRRVVWKADQENQLKAMQALNELGITDCKSSPCWFYINIPYHAYFSSFTNSDNPVDWWRRNLKKWSAQIEKDRLEHESYLEAQREKERLTAYYQSEEYKAECARRTAEYVAQQAQKAADEREKERLISLGKQHQEDLKKRSEIKAVEIVDIREIEVEGD